MTDLHEKHLFTKCDSPFDTFTFPVKVIDVVDEETVKGFFDIDSMSTIKRIIATTL